MRGGETGEGAGGRMVLELPEELTVARAAELKALLLPALEGGRALELGARTVREVDVAGLQILLAARRSGEARQLRLSFSPAPSAALCQTMAAAGFGVVGSEGWPVEEVDHG